MAHMQWISGTKQALIKNITSICFAWDFSADHLEKQLGKLRQGCGGTYFMTVQQIMEKWVSRKQKFVYDSMMVAY